MNEQAIIKEQELNDGHVLKIFHDTWAESPRSWDNLGTMAIFHTKYNFGDDVDFSSKDFDSWAEMEEYINSTLEAVICLPIYMYDHSGITINCDGFSCPWDSGQVGFIYVTEQKMIDDYGKAYTKEHIEKARKVLLSEVKTMDLYITGEVYGFHLLKDGEVIDSCCGFYGEDLHKNGMVEHIPTKLIPENI
jgi:hypothetical protein